MTKRKTGGVRPKKIGRRGFLKSAIAGAGGVAGFPMIVPSSALGADGMTPPSDRITMASIGVGRMGGGDLNNFLRFQDARVLAICDVQQARQEQMKALVDRTYGDNVCATYRDFRELMERKDIDAMVLATGERWTPIIGAEAARRGIHMYYEKPLALTAQDAKAIRAAIRQCGVTFQFGTQQRSSQYFRFACELVRNGKIGQLQKVVIGSSGGDAPLPPEEPKNPPPGFDWDMWLGPAPWVPYSDLRVSLYWLRISDYGLGNLAGGWGIHDIDIAQWVNNSDHTMPVSVEGTGTLYSDIRDTIRTYDIEHNYANGVKIHFMNLAAARQRYPQYPREAANSVVLLGSEGWIWVSRQGMQTNPASLMQTVFGPNDHRVIMSNDHRRNFLDAVRSGQPPISPIEVAARDEMICQMSDIAVRLKRRLQWDPVKEEFINDEQANRRLSRPMRSPWRIEVPQKPA
jgi:myo-inositol 2-dehydrogenase / D-chiro-inositol 1-dehydrogenase